MKGKWKVTANPIGDEVMYAVYRLRNVNAVDHSGNREFATSYMESVEEAMKMAAELNTVTEKDSGDGNLQSQ